MTTGTTLFPVAPKIMNYERGDCLLDYSVQGTRIGTFVLGFPDPPSGSACLHYEGFSFRSALHPVFLTCNREAGKKS